MPPRRRARRVATRLAVCAVIGVVATVAVAWLIDAVLPKPGATHVRSGWQEQGWGVEVPHDWPQDPGDWAELRMSGWEMYSVQRNGQQVNGVFRVTRFRAGWPFFAVAGTQYLWWTEKEFGRRYVGIRFPERLFPKRTGEGLPVVPLFPGFALDTAFYAAIALTLWSAPGVIRRRLRRARGHCPSCGYNLKGAPTTTCPECGS